LPPINGALEGMDKLCQEGYELVIITSRAPRYEAVTKRWFDRHFPTVKIEFTMGRNNPYAGGNGRLHKPQAAEKAGVNCLVEDNEGEFHHWDSDLVTPICYAQPWNVDLVTTHPQILRTEWPGILEFILK